MVVRGSTHSVRFPEWQLQVASTTVWDPLSFGSWDNQNISIINVSELGGVPVVQKGNVTQKEGHTRHDWVYQLQILVLLLSHDLDQWSSECCFSRLSIYYWEGSWWAFCIYQPSQHNLNIIWSSCDNEFCERKFFFS